MHVVVDVADREILQHPIYPHSDFHWHICGYISATKQPTHLRQVRHSPFLALTTMSLIFTLSILTAVRALNVIQTNDDGWATAAIRAQHAAFNQTGIFSVISAPAENGSGTGSLDVPAIPLIVPCEFNSCPAGSPPHGYETSDPTINYVNSFPVTSLKYGLETLAPKFFGRAPDLVVSGPNVGPNLGVEMFFSGTVGAATAAANAGIPALAISSKSGEQVSFTTLQPNDVYFLHAALTVRLINALISAGAPFLPSNTLLNVNYPTAGTGKCTAADAFTFVLTRVFANPFHPGPKTCGGGALPLESDVSGNENRCDISVSVVDGADKTDAPLKVQQAVLDKLQGFLGCTV